MSMRDFVILQKIGDGAYSEVYKVKRVSDGLMYALKKVKMAGLSQKEKENALNEVRILASINSPYIVGYKEAFFEDKSTSLCIVMEYANSGDLYQKITDHQKANQLIHEKDIWRTIIEMSKALQILHEKNIFHRDLKSANVFLNKNGVSKLGDLNVSKVAKKGLLYTQTGTPYYASPEVWKDQPYDSKSDIWSLGCVIYEMTSLKPPFRAQDMNGLYKKVIKGAYPQVPKKYTKDLSEVIMKMLSVEPKLRPSCQQILDLEQVQRRMVKLFPQGEHDAGMYEFDENGIDEDLMNKNGLLNTIKVPQNLASLTKRLPKSNYSLRDNISLPARSVNAIGRLGVSTGENSPMQNVQTQNSEHIRLLQPQRSLPQLNTRSNRGKIDSIAKSRHTEESQQMNQRNKVTHSNQPSLDETNLQDNAAILQIPQKDPKYLLKIKQKSMQQQQHLSKLATKSIEGNDYSALMRSNGASVGNNRAIAEFERENGYISGRSKLKEGVDDRRTLSINSRAQQVVNKQRLEQLKALKKEAAKQKVQSQHHNLKSLNEQYSRGRNGTRVTDQVYSGLRNSINSPIENNGIGMSKKSSLMYRNKRGLPTPQEQIYSNNTYDANDLNTNRLNSVPRQNSIDQVKSHASKQSLRRNDSRNRMQLDNYGRPIRSNQNIIGVQARNSPQVQKIQTHDINSQDRFARNQNSKANILQNAPVIASHNQRPGSLSNNKAPGWWG